MLKLAYEVNIMMVSQMKFKCISTVMSLLEENISDNAINKLMLSIPAEEVIRNINQTHARYEEAELKYIQENLDIDDQKELVLPLGFKLYFVLQEYIEKGLEVDTDTPPMKFYEIHTKTIEVVHNSLFTVRFPEPPVYISEAFKKEFLEGADRTSINSKLQDLQEADIKNRSNQPGYILTLLVLVMNILDIIIFHGDQIPFIQNFNFYSRIAAYTATSDTATEEILEIIVQLTALGVSIAFYAIEIIGAVYLRGKIEEIVNNPKLTFWGKLKARIKLIMTNLNYSYYLLTTVLLLLGMFCPFFDTIVLIVEAFRQNETFFEIGKAIVESMGQLAVVLLILIISNYILVVFVYFRYNSAYAPCSGTLYSCLSFGVDTALKTDFGIVGYNDSPNTILSDFLGDTIFDVLFDLVYLFVIKIVIEQVMGAIIVDKFAQIREATEKRQEDEETKCYICGMDVEIFDREEDGFERHKE